MINPEEGSSNTDNNLVAAELLDRYAQLDLSDANEAETRLKLIDRIFFELLGWSHDDVTVEERVTEDSGLAYTDYVFRTANTAFIVEAKRVGQTFKSVGDMRRSKLTGNLVKGQSGDAIKQVRDYCRQKSIQFAVATNGAQWVVFPAVRTDQVSFANSSAIIFDSLATVLGQEFDDFYELLSRDAVINGHLELELLGRSEDQIEERRLNAFYGSTGRSKRNPIYPLIQDAITEAFTDSIIDKDDQLLEKCYVPSADRIRFDKKIKMHLQRADSLFSRQAARPLRRSSDAKVLSESVEAARGLGRPLAVLVLGPVGAGKTTYLNYSRRVSAKAFFSEKKDRLYPQWIQIDFRKLSGSESPTDFVYSCLLEYMRDEPLLKDWGRAVRPAYGKDIESLKAGPLHLLAKNEEKFEEKISELVLKDYESVTPYVDKVLGWLGGHEPIFLVVDNVDQFESSDFQSKIFSECIAIASRIGLNLVMSMRESTYIEHRHSATFDAFDFDPIQIEPPQIGPVLSRRFFVAKNILKNRPGEFRTQSGPLFRAADLSVFMDVVQSSVLGTEVGTRIEVLADGDVRLALRMTREFLESGYSDPAKAIAVVERGETYTMPKHEALRSIILGNKTTYSEELSVLGNPFDSRQGITNLQLLRTFILNALVSLSSDGRFKKLDGPTIRDECNKIGVSQDITLNTLKDLCRLNFVSTSSHAEADFTSSFFPSRLGGFIIRDLMADMTFVENVLLDTFIDEKETWEILRKLSDEIQAERQPTKRLKVRVKRVKAFYEYMEELYTPLAAEAQRRALPKEWCSNPLKENKTRLWNNCNQAIKSSTRHYPAKAKR